jgi:hypothetical protein
VVLEDEPDAAVAEAGELLLGEARGILPARATVPDVGLSSAPRIASSVLLPLPDGPITQTDSPGASAIETPSRIVSDPVGPGYSLRTSVATRPSAIRTSGVSRGGAGRRRGSSES